MPKNEKTTYLVIGCGALVYEMHLPALKAEDCQIAAMSDLSAVRGRPRAQALGAPFYTDYQDMLQSHPEADAVVVLTPHYNHAQITIDSLNAGFHVLVEKPMALHLAEAQAMVAAADQQHRLLAVNFQQRLRPEVRAAKSLLAKGQLGTLQRMSLVVTWPRSRAYYKLAPWRATWQGEGGGVLMNQAPHDLDLICFLMGMPDRVFAWNQTRYHHIEVEDTINALLRWKNGAVGHIHISTQESDETGQMEITGTGGLLRIKPGTLAFSRFETDVHQFLEKADPFDRVTARPETVSLPAGKGNHQEVHKNFRDSIRGKAHLICPGSEGLKSLALANGMILSSHQDRPIDFPLDAKKYAQLLNRLQANGKKIGNPS